MARVVVIGGGIGGLEAARYLKSHGIEPLVVTSSDYYISGPSRPLILSGEQSLDRIARGYAHSGVEVLVDHVISINPDENTVKTFSGREIPYDYLVIATGVKYDYTFFQGPVYNVYEIGKLFDLKHLVWNLKEGKILVYAPPQPYRCAPAPAETATTIDMVLRHRGVRENVEILFIDANPKVQPPVIHDVWVERFEQLGIEYVLNTRIERIKENTAFLSSGEEVTADIFVVLPPNKGYSPFGEGFLEVRGPYDLRLKSYDNVYAVGDVAKLPFPKNSEITSVSARIAAGQIVADMGFGEEHEETYRFVGWAYAGNPKRLATQSIKFELSFETSPPRGSKDPEPKEKYTKQKDLWEQAVLKKLFGY